MPLSFEILGPIYGIETISTGHGIRDLAELQKTLRTREVKEGEGLRDGAARGW